MYIQTYPYTNTKTQRYMSHKVNDHSEWSQITEYGCIVTQSRWCLQQHTRSPSMIARSFNHKHVNVGPTCSMSTQCLLPEDPKMDYSNHKKAFHRDVTSLQIETIYGLSRHVYRWDVYVSTSLSIQALFIRYWPPFVTADFRGFELAIASLTTLPQLSCVNPNVKGSDEQETCQ